MVTKNTWLELRTKNSIDLEHIHFGINLNNTIDLEIDKLQNLLNVIKVNAPMAIQKIMMEAKMRLDKHFSVITLINVDGQEIKTIK